MIIQKDYLKIIFTLKMLVIILLILAFLLLIYLIWQAHQLQKELQTELIEARAYALPALDWSKLNSLSLARTHINDSFEVAQQNLGEINSKLAEAIKLSVTGGKRIRAALLLDVAARAAPYQSIPIDATETALALECLHASSLVIDDMPHFDNDTIRRGHQTVHTLYGEATAQMAATALSALAMEYVVRQAEQLRQNASPQEAVRANQTASKLIVLVADSLGAKGAAAGQLQELACIVEDDSAQIDTIMAQKTATVFEAAVLAGWYIGTSRRQVQPSSAETAQVKAAAYKYGMAFQLADDLNDYQQDIDMNHGHINYAVVHGKKAARKQIQKYLKESAELLQALHLWSPIWQDAQNCILK